MTAWLRCNIAGLRTVCQYLGLPFRHRICSQLALEFPDKLHAGQWAPWLAAQLAADIYINPAAGRELFDPAEFARNGIKLQFLEFTTFTYRTPGYNFEKDLSILDVLMWNSPEEIMEGIRRNCVLASPDG